MEEVKRKIKCPSCGVEIDVNEVLYHQVDEELKREYDNELEKEKEKLNSKAADLQKEKQDFEENKRLQEDEIGKKVHEQVKQRETDIRKALKTELADEHSDAMKLMQDEIAEKSTKLKELNKAQMEVEKLKREKEELGERFKLEAEQELNKKLSEEKEKIIKAESSKNELTVRELQKQLEDQKKLTEEMKRKQEQGSMQMQGEVQELAIEEWLANTFPLDTIQEIKKGERGADCVQTVHTRSHQNCGKIYYESKRTKSFQPTWIEKFKQDIRNEGANIGVLVTEAMPNEMERFGLKDGIWICSYEEFKGLCSVLRESVIQINNAAVSQENKGDKMGMLYDFLTSTEFQMQIEAIVEGFTQMKGDLEAEKRAMQSIWKKRDKQIEKVVFNTTNMYGSIKGIAGNAVKEIEFFELKHIAEEDNGSAR
jgi:hypothetical protein